MATIYKEFLVEADATQVWDALRDFGAVHTRLAPGFVTDCRVEDNVRVITFGNGAVARELFVGLDEAARRLCYTVVGSQATHHNASAQVFPEGDGRTRFVWITDVLPDTHAKYVDAMMSQGGAVMQKTLGRHP